MNSYQSAQSNRTLFRTFWFILALLLVLQGFWLWSYESTNPIGNLPYSGVYLSVLLAHACLTCLIGSMAMAPNSAVSLALQAVVASRAWVRSRFVLVLSVWILWCLWTAGSAGTSLGRSRAFFLLTVAVCSWLTLGILSSAQESVRAALKRALQCVSIGTSALCAIAVCEIFLHTNPGVMPAGLVVQLPGGGEFLQPLYSYDKPIVRGYWYIPGKQVTGVLTESLSALYVIQPDVMRPLRQDNVLSTAVFMPDENGYRNTMPLRERYDIVVGGDSFASVSFEPRPWPVILSEMLDKQVYNLAMQGYSPQATAQTIRMLGLPKQPRVVVFGYYEGNDLIDACVYENKAASGLNWAEYDVELSSVLDRSLVWRVLKYVTLDSIPQPRTEPAMDSAPFPFECEFGGAKVELGFAIHELSRLAMTPQQIHSACGFGAMIKQIIALHHASTTAGAQLIIAYCPTKESCYVPLLPRHILEEKVAHAFPPIVRKGRILQDRTRRLEVDALLDNVDTFRQYLMEVLQASGIRIVDLTPGFREAAARGSVLYHANDSHWCARGHELAAKLIADYLRDAAGL